MDVQTVSVNGYFEVVKEDSPLYERVVELFQEVIAPLYGDQTQALQKIGKAVDRTCEVLVVDGVAMAVLVYKNEPSGEFPDAPNALEIKTLFVVSGQRRTGHGTKVMERVKELAKEAKFGSVAVTVSANVPSSLNFFQKNGFVPKVTWVGKYLPGVTEYLMVLNR